MGDFIKNNPFRFWCQKVLPLVYDDSLSYYELLCKVVGKLNELAENQNNLSDEIKAVAKDLDDFKAQVPGMVEAKVEEWLNNYITTHGLVNSVNGMTGVVTLTAADVGAIANVNGSVKNNNIADGAVTAEKIDDGAVTGDKIAGKAITANKLADGVIPEKLPNPQKLTFTGAVTGEYDGSQAVNIDIPAGGGGSGGGAVDSVNGMTGAVVLKKLTAGEGLSMSGEDGYNGSAEQSVGIAPGGVSSDKIADGAVTADKMASGGISSDKIADGAITADKMASGVIPTKLPNPHKLTFTGAASGTYDGSADKSVEIPTVPAKLPNPKPLKITVNGTSTVYNGEAEKTVTINSGLSHTLTAGTGLVGGTFDGSKNARFELKEPSVFIDNSSAFMQYGFALVPLPTNYMVPVQILLRAKKQLGAGKSTMNLFPGFKINIAPGLTTMMPLVANGESSPVGVVRWVHNGYGSNGNNTFTIECQFNKTIPAGMWLYGSGLALMSETV